MTAPNLAKADLIAFLATEAGVSKSQASAVLEALGPLVRKSAEDGYTVSMPGLGRFATKERAARVGRNPRTGADVEIPASRVLTFKASKPKS